MQCRKKLTGRAESISSIAQWSRGVTKPLSTFWHFWVLLLMIRSDNSEFSFLKPFLMSSKNFEIKVFVWYGLY